MTNRVLDRFSRSALFASALLLPPLQAHAGDPRAGDDWRYDASLYLWGAGVGGETASRRNPGGSSDIDVGFDTVLNNLNMAFMGAFSWTTICDASIASGRPWWYYMMKRQLWSQLWTVAGGGAQSGTFCCTTVDMAALAEVGAAA